MSSLNTVSLHGSINLGGATGTSDYTELENKPKINNVELIGNKTTSELNINEMPTSDSAAVGSILTHTANGDAWAPPKSQVEANPIGATVGDLSTIGIQGVNYKIPSGGGLNYSTDEQIVGTWYDGKPLYQKTYVGSWNLSGSSWSSTITNIPNSKLCKVECLDTDNQYMGVNGNISPSGDLTLYNLRGTTLTGKIITVWYTKTTDTIGGE